MEESKDEFRFKQAQNGTHLITQVGSGYKGVEVYLKGQLRCFVVQRTHNC
jgi:hypothetical protein